MNRFQNNCGVNAAANNGCGCKCYVGCGCGIGCGTVCYVGPTASFPDAQHARHMRLPTLMLS